MKRVLQIVNYMPPHVGGIEQVAHDIILALKDSCMIKTICFNHEKGTSEDQIEETDVIRVGCQAKIASQSLAFSYGAELKKVITEFDPNIVIFHYPNPFVASFLMKYLKRKRFVFVLWWHLDIVKQKILGKFFYSQNKKLLHYADHIISTSPNYIAGSPWLSSAKEKCTVVPCCVNNKRTLISADVIQLANQIEIENKGKTICFGFGRHVPYKGMNKLVEASRYLGQNYKVFIGGVGPETKKLLKMPNNGNLVFLGKLSEIELKAYLLACKVFCFPSVTKNEAFGIGLAEAMALGKPAVAFTIPGSGVNYVNLNGVTGIEVPNGDAKMFADAIMTIAENQNLYDTFSINARDRVNNLFSQERFENDVKRLINEW